MYFGKQRKMLIALIIFLVLVFSGFLANAYYSKQNRQISDGQRTSLPIDIGDFQKISNKILLSGGKPWILFMGSEACPYCAAESWAIFDYLNQKGTITNIQYIYSNSSDIYPNTPGISFANSSFESKSIGFTGIEMSNRNWQPLNDINQSDLNLFNQYDSKGEIPFILVDGIYLKLGSSYSPGLLKNQT
jgi:hypothetical protein